MRVGVLLPTKKREDAFYQRRMPYERFQTNGDINSSVKDINLFDRRAPIPKRFSNPKRNLEIYHMRNPLPKQTDLQFKQPNPISTSPFVLRREMVAIPQTNDVLNAQFLRDRKMTRGMLNSKQLDKMMALKAKRLKKKQMSTINFNPLSTTLNGLNTASNVASGTNAVFA